MNNRSCRYLSIQFAYIAIGGRLAALRSCGSWPKCNVVCEVQRPSEELKMRNYFPWVFWPNIIEASDELGSIEYFSCSESCLCFIDVIIKISNINYCSSYIKNIFSKFSNFLSGSTASLPFMDCTPLVNRHKKDWDQYLSFLMAFRSVVYETTKYSGYLVKWSSKPPDEVSEQVDCAEKLKRKFLDIYEWIEERMNLKAYSTGFFSGDKVWILKPWSNKIKKNYK